MKKASLYRLSISRAIQPIFPSFFYTLNSPLTPLLTPLTPLLTPLRRRRRRPPPPPPPPHSFQQRALPPSSPLFFHSFNQPRQIATATTTKTTTTAKTKTAKKAPTPTTEKTQSPTQNRNVTIDVVNANESNLNDLIQNTKKPIILELYLDWSDLCKQQEQYLHEYLAATKGVVRLIKLNVDESPAVLQALRVPSIPQLYGIFNGEKVSEFEWGLAVQSGKAPELLRQFVNNMASLAQSEEPFNSKHLFQEADSVLDSSPLDVVRASQIFNEILNNDQSERGKASALAGLARCALLEEKLDVASEILSRIQSQYVNEYSDNPDVKRAVSLLQLQKRSKEGKDLDIKSLVDKVEKHPDDLAARYELAVHCFSKGDYDRAIDETIKLIRLDRHWNEEAGRKLIVQIVEALGPHNPRSQIARKRFSNVWFS